MKKIIVLSVLFLLFLACKHEKSIYKNPEITRMENLAVKTFGSDSCFCLPASQAAACTNTVIKQFLGNNTTVIKTINWAMCTAAFGPGPVTDPNCNTQYGINTVTTQVEYCWFDCNTVRAKFLGKPPCIPCFPDNFCFLLKPTKSTNAYILQASNLLNDYISIQIYISTDPDVTISCQSPPVGSTSTISPTIFTCYGSY